MSLFGAAPSDLTKAAGYCENTAQYIEGMRQRVQVIKGDLQWKGGAYLNFAKAMDQWDLDFKAVIKILEGIYDKLNVGAGVYSQAAAETENMNITGGQAGAGSAGRIDDLINSSSQR
ncbi:WXG100 family type VII secretion target [Nonomuraea rhizosphaerae]|uniref:WXG100 family type VII secretion target n=1 Tax=Nonomuraea rhizosphaerae TaxID=2665663 RepID=UPI001C5FB4E6|nr:WXG100 family type VII secretion target [Nonomuraea rhizosphaerae]